MVLHKIATLVWSEVCVTYYFCLPREEDQR
jgi:hypothetical protein